MTLLAPLGLIGLLGVVALIIIYIIKPNYQQKLVSSTYVWKLSLKYKRKRIPTSKLRQILIIICQILILACSAFILARPNKLLNERTDAPEVICIIDSSASMLTINEDEESRFERAISEVEKLTDGIYAQNGVVSVILATDDPYYVTKRSTMKDKSVLKDDLNQINKDGPIYGSSSIDKAVELTEDILIENPSAKVYLYTDNDYSYVPQTVNLNNVAEVGEWNASILDARAVFEEGYYSFYIDVACYGRNQSFYVNIDIYGMNSVDGDGGYSRDYSHYEYFEDGVPRTIVFRYSASEVIDAVADNYIIEDIDAVLNYEYLYVSLEDPEDEDSFSLDNTFYIYGGQKEIIKIEYASSNGNPFISSIFDVIKNTYPDRYDIQITEVKRGTEPEYGGFDMYIFEGLQIDVMPTDGVVVFLDPQRVPKNAGFKITTLDMPTGARMPLSASTEHVILDKVNPEFMWVSQYTKISSLDAGFETILDINSSPVFAVKNDGPSKVALVAFDIHFAGTAVDGEFALLMHNMFMYYFPTMVYGNAFEVNESVQLVSRGSYIEISGNIEKTIDEFPAVLQLSMPGTYELTQEDVYGKSISEKVYVNIPQKECNVWLVEDSIVDPYYESYDEFFYKDLLMYFALAMVALIIVEAVLNALETA